jgi:hypothetical protein
MFKIFLGLSPVGVMTIFYWHRFETPLTWRVRSPYLYPQKQGGPTQPWLQSFQYGVSITFSCRKWQQDILKYYQRECLVRSVVVCSQGLKSSGETDHLGFPFNDLDVPARTLPIHFHESSLQFAENMTLVFLCCVNIGIIHEQSKMSSRCLWGIVCVQTVWYWGKYGTLRNPCCYISWHRKVAFNQDFKFSVSEKRSN